MNSENLIISLVKLLLQENQKVNKAQTNDNDNDYDNEQVQDIDSESLKNQSKSG